MKRTKRTAPLRLFCGLLALVINAGTKPAIGAEPQFDVIVLGAAGGLTEGNLSAYLLAPLGSSAFVSLDAGVLLTGLQRANSKGNLSSIVEASASPLSAEGQMLTQHIKAYLVSHAHFDHITGLVMNSRENHMVRECVGGVRITWNPSCSKRRTARRLTPSRSRSSK